jgi:serine palmitoyltransferase
MSGAPSSTLEPLLTLLAYSLSRLESTFYKIPGSAVVARYVKSSHQNDPGRTILELFLVIFAVRTLLQSRTRGDKQGKHFIQFSEKVCSPAVQLPHVVDQRLGNRRTRG